LSWQEQPSPNSNYTDTLVNDIRGLRLEKDAWSGFCPTPSLRPSGRPRKPAWRLWPGRQAFGFDRRATKRSFWDDLAGNRPLVEDLDVAGRRARRIIASIPLNEQALDVRRGLCPAFEIGGSKPPIINIRVEGMAFDSCVERTIRATPGVGSASVNLATNRAEVIFSGVLDIAASLPRSVWPAMNAWLRTPARQT
jgi:hypothetical protein